MVDLSSSALLPLLFFIAAFLYASVGHGGASAYLALLALLNFPLNIARPTALIINAIVSMIAFLSYRARENFRCTLFLWLVAASIPASFMGARMTLSESLYHGLLGALLIFSALRLLWVGKAVMNAEIRQAAIPAILILGAVIGFLSGMLGIGGGVLLSPALIFLAWASPRESAVLSALFIFVNSLSGLSALTQSSQSWLPMLPWSLMMAAIAGGLLGAYFGSKRFSNVHLSRVLAVVLLIAGMKLAFPLAVSILMLISSSIQLHFH